MHYKLYIIISILSVFRELYIYSKEIKGGKSSPYHFDGDIQHVEVEGILLHVISLYYTYYNNEHD
jgi:hypothetical protein